MQCHKACTGLRAEPPDLALSAMLAHSLCRLLLGCLSLSCLSLGATLARAQEQYGQSELATPQREASSNAPSSAAGRHLFKPPISPIPVQFQVPLTPPFRPIYRTVSQVVQPNPQLPPAQLELFNSHRYALIVLLGDTRKDAVTRQFHIPPGGSQVVSLDRDAGATIVETVELRNPLGGWERQQFLTVVPPSALYDLSVYEEHLQSIAIDRTGKSPNQVEDVNYVPKSVGWIPLPAGTGLPSFSRLDVYSRAQASKNPGAVRRLDPRQFDVPPADPLGPILQGLNASAEPQSTTPSSQTTPPQPATIPTPIPSLPPAAPQPATAPPATPHPPNARRSF